MFKVLPGLPILLVHLSRCVQEFDEIVFRTRFIIDLNRKDIGVSNEQQEKNSLSFSTNSHSHSLFAPLKSSGNDDS